MLGASTSGVTGIFFAKWLRRLKTQTSSVRSDEFLPRILRNMAHLVSGNASALLLGVVTLGLMARSLGPAALGMIVLVESFGKLIDQIVRLETWQSFIRYGTAALEHDDRTRFLRLIKFGTVVDLVGAFSAAVICFLLSEVAGQIMGWSADAVGMAQTYAIAVLFGVSSTPLGILRIFDRFSVIAWVDPAAAVVRLACVAAAAATGASPWAYLVILITVQVMQRLVLSFAAYRTLKAKGYVNFLAVPLTDVHRENAGIWRMILSANAIVLIRKSTQEVDVLAVGALLGSSAAGIYQIARRLGYALTKAGGTLQQAAFPDLARQWVRGEVDKFKRLVKQIETFTVVGAIACSIALILFAEPLILVIAGPNYLAATTPLIIHSIATLLFLCGSALRPALASMGLQTHLLGIVAVSAVVFYATLAVAIPRFGIAGASVAHLAANAILLPAIAVLFARGIKGNNRVPVRPGDDPPG